MVRQIFLFLTVFFIQLSAEAQFFARANYFSWQEEVAVEGLSGLELATLTLSGVGVGYEFLKNKRWRYGVSGYILTGDANLHALGSGNSARRNSSAVVGEARVIYRMTKTLALGGIGTFGQTQLSATSKGTNFGAYFALEYDLNPSIRFTQSVGTVGMSSSLAYAFSLSQAF